MKLLFDENLSPKLVARLSAEYPGSAHVRDVALRGRSDDEIWDLAKAEGLTVVSKDTDFRERSFVHGFPPKIIWLEVGNVGTDTIANLLRANSVAVADFITSGESSILILSQSGNAI